jgi:adenylate kinase
VVQRKDDTEAVVQTRYDDYKAKTEPVLAHYQPKGVVVTVNGVGSLDEVNQRIRAAVGVS